MIADLCVAEATGDEDQELVLPLGQLGELLRRLVGIGASTPSDQDPSPPRGRSGPPVTFVVVVGVLVFGFVLLHLTGVVGSTH